MKNEKNVAETSRRIVWLKQELKDITELKEKAFEVFDECFGLVEMEDNFKKYWKQLIRWTHNADNVEKHFGNLWVQGDRTIKKAFDDLLNGFINRKEFKDALEESQESVDIYIKKLQTEISEEQKHLSELYDEFARNSGDLSFIFTAPQIKQLIMDKFLQV